MGNNNDEMPILELKPCERCGNPFMLQKGQSEQLTEIVCDNCKMLEARKKELMLGVFDKVIEVENQMENSINEMKDQLTMTKGKFNKDFFLQKIKKRADVLKKSIELVEKIENTNEEKYIDEYKNLFEQMKNEYS
ncbi:MAG: hypothetical protein GF383_06585 [Candidatus Lokiarchaeota archaeon]|nr:hypothetical protein [Candidatus Lokiarchaeota archaeon]MBD3339758.1 hypothetical protein [Candidatus Lokiarchaeota archaeon]